MRPNSKNSQEKLKKEALRIFSLISPRASIKHTVTFFYALNVPSESAKKGCMGMFHFSMKYIELNVSQLTCLMMSQVKVMGWAMLAVQYEDQGHAAFSVSHPSEYLKKNACKITH